MYKAHEGLGLLKYGRGNISLLLERSSIEGGKGSWGSCEHSKNWMDANVNHSAFTVRLQWNNEH